MIKGLTEDIQNMAKTYVFHCFSVKNKNKCHQNNQKRKIDMNNSKKGLARVDG